MSAGKKIKVAVVGLGFGAEFIPLYQKHPDAECYAICQRDEAKLKQGRATLFKVERRFTRFEDLLTGQGDRRHPRRDAHRRARAHDRSPRWRRASTPPAPCPWPPRSRSASTIAEARRKAGKVYMMMETAVYTREFLYVKELADKGELGKLQFLRGSHQQNMSLPGWPDYWYGFPPMHYATHAVSPLLCAGRQRRSSRWSASAPGRIREEYAKKYGSPVRGRDGADEAARLGPRLRGDPLAVRHHPPVPRELRRVRHQALLRVGAARRREARCCTPASRTRSAWRSPTSASGCPRRSRPTPSTASTTRSTSTPRSSRAPATAGRTRTWPTSSSGPSSRSGSPRVDARRAANWTMAGICAHESAMKGGRRVEVPPPSRRLTSLRARRNAMAKDRDDRSGQPGVLQDPDGGLPGHPGAGRERVPR